MRKINITWYELYSSYIKADYKTWDEYFLSKMKLKKRFLDLVIKYSVTGKPILECGAGTGKSSAFLASLGFDVYAIDLEPAMVEQAKELSDSISPHNPVKVSQGNIMNIPFNNKYFSVAHSSGVLEHFKDSKIVEIINEQIRVADTIVFSVPSPYFEKKMMGDERFMLRNKWRKIISQSKTKIIKETGYHYKPFKKRFGASLKNPRILFKPIALYVFVLRER